MPKGPAIKLKFVPERVGQVFAARRDPPQPSNSSSKTLSRHLYIAGGVRIPQALRPGRQPLYSEAERQRRDASGWTLVQGVLAPVQFVIFLASLALVARYLLTGEGIERATLSVVVKTLALYTIMVTGCLWERAVFGRYLFAEAFFWEDAFSMLVLALHTLYLVALATDGLSSRGLMYLALAAYAAYVINATQFLLKLRAARLDRRDSADETSERVGFIR